MTLGAGSQGRVIKVKRFEDNTEYAMKVVPAAVMNELSLAKQIIQETLLLHTLKHENIIKVTDFFRLKSGKFVSVMEYQDGYDFETIVDDPEKVMRKHKRFAD